MDFQFLQNPISKKWVISAPRRAKRPDVARGSEPICPFCPGKENLEEEVYRIPALRKSEIQSTKSETNTNNKINNDKNVSSFGIRDSNLDGWLVRVLSNKYPFAPIHQVIIHSPDHHKNFDQLSLKQIQRILETYRHQYNEYAHKGQVYIFHNRGEVGGESLPHPHSQLAVVPFEVRLDIPRLDLSANVQVSTREKSKIRSTKFETNTNNKNMNDKNVSDFDIGDSNFLILCPQSSQWPDEVWVAPKKRGRAFGEITNAEIVDLSHILQRLIQIFDLRHGNNFPFNFYIYPGGDWYLRIIPRLKVLGGFELGTGIYVNTQKPEETLAFIKEHFGNTDQEKIKQQHQAEYEKTV